MADTPIDERKFTDQEVREILKRAVEKAPSRTLVKSEGLSLAELKSIGGEVGIDPDRLEDAARAVTVRGNDQPSRILGAPRVLNFERKVEGEFNPADTPETLSVIRRIMGQQGEADEIHGSLEWAGKGEVGERYVTLSSRDGTTTIRGSANLTQSAVVTFLPGGFLGIIASIVTFMTAANSGSQVGLVISLAILPTLYTILRTVFRKLSGSESAKLQQVVDELARLMKGSGD